MSKMMRVTDLTGKYLNKLSQEIKQSKQSIIEDAVKMFSRNYFLEKTNQEYLELRKDPSAWKEELKERQGWDCTLLDGLEGDDFEY